MVTVYGFKSLPEAPIGLTRDLRVFWALEELKAPYRVQGVDFLAGELAGESYHRLNPFAQIPTIDDDGLVLTESGAIVLYLAEKFGGLLPKDAAGRAQVQRWCFAALTSVEPPLTELFILRFLKTQDQPLIDFHVEWVKKFLRQLDARMADQTWIATAEFSAADILLCSVLRLANRMGVLTDYQNLQAYRHRCEERPAWRKVVEQYETRLGLPRGGANPT